MSALPARPPISAPVQEGGGSVAVGVRGLWLVVPIAVLLAVGAGGPEESVLILGPLVTYALPLVVMVAFWWEDWPGTRLGPNWSGWADTALIAAGGVVLAVAGQWVAGGIDLRGLFDPSPGPGHVPSFPATLPLAGAVFIVMLQLTLVGEGWPLRRFGAAVGGPLALLVAWAIGLGLYFALVEVSPPPGSGVTARSGPVAGADFGAAVACIGAWQVLCFVVWRGWPSAGISSRALRLSCAHTVVLGCGLLSFLAARLVLEAGTLTGVAGCVVAAGIVCGMLLEVPLGRAAGALVTLVLAATLFGALSVLAQSFSFTRAEPEDWVVHASLNALAASAILHVAVGRRWPLNR